MIVQVLIIWYAEMLILVVNKTNLKFKNFKPYTNVVLNILDLNEKEGLILYLETWINRKYNYWYAGTY